MILYDWKCVDCSHTFESLEKMDTREIKCPKCGEKAERQISPTKIWDQAPHARTGKRIY